MMFEARGMKWRRVKKGTKKKKLCMKMSKWIKSRKKLLNNGNPKKQYQLLLKFRLCAHYRISNYLGQKVLTAVTVEEVDQQQQAPAQQESATIIEESVNGDAEEEVPEFASFSHSNNPDWSFPLLPSDPGYVAPSAKTKDSKKSKTQEIASTPETATAGPSNATAKHVARRDSSTTSSTTKPTSITSTKIAAAAAAAASPRRASRSNTPPVSSLQPPSATTLRKNVSSATAEVSPPIPSSASAATKAPIRRATRSSLVIPPLPVTSDPGSEGEEDGPPSADEDVALDNSGLNGEDIDETGGFDDVPPAAEDFDGQDDDSFGQPMDEDAQIPDSLDLSRDHESGNPEQNELEEEGEEEEIAATSKPARQQNASKATKSQGKKRSRSTVDAEENETRSKARVESSKPVAPRKKSVAKSAAPSETVVIPVSKEEEGEGRHKRARVPPVQFWKLESVQYENRRSSMGDTMVPYAVGVAKKEPDEVASTGPKKTQISKSRKPVKKEKITLSSPDMLVMDSETNQEVAQRIVYTDDMLQPQVVGNGDAFLYQRTFSVGNFCGSGVIILPKGVSKPNKNSGSTALFIIVMHGRIRVKIYKNSFEVGQGSKVLVPRGNQYSLENTGNTDATLYFFQARDPSEAADAEAGQASSSSTSNANGKPKAPKETPATDKPKKAEPKAAVAKKAVVKEPAPKPAPTRKGRGKQG
ncbi:Mif2/CENP-C like-domain-containing protein [Chytriomyces cf. hyalinus JEL632]|nr:Mif2/CENP-C like-domain-containing protein [Chytriomyces cf. hyalinus JEL632]